MLRRTLVLGIALVGVAFVIADLALSTACGGWAPSSLACVARADPASIGIFVLAILSLLSVFRGKARDRAWMGAAISGWSLIVDRYSLFLMLAGVTILVSGLLDRRSSAGSSQLAMGFALAGLATALGEELLAPAPHLTLWIVVTAFLALALAFRRPVIAGIGGLIALMWAASASPFGVRAEFAALLAAASCASVLAKEFLVLTSGRSAIGRPTDGTGPGR